LAWHRRAQKAAWIATFAPARDAVTRSHLQPFGSRHDLSEDSAVAEHLVCAARLFERQPLCDQGLNTALFQQLQQS
jgi:hypothetical protein